MEPWRSSCFCRDLFLFLSLKMQQKFAVTLLYKGKVLFSNLQGNRMAKQGAEEEETGDGTLLRKQ